VKPEYPKHRKVRRVSRDARLLNIHLWNLADDDGRLQELPQWIIGAIFPTDEDVTAVVLSAWLAELEEAGLITRYEVGGERYIFCHDFSDHQTISHPKRSTLPAPPGERSRNGTGTLREGSCQEGKGREGNNTTSSKLDDAGTIRALFDYWRERCRHPGAKLDNGDTRWQKVGARLREGYTPEQIRKAIDGAAVGAYVNDAGKRFDDLELICRNKVKLEDFIERATGGSVLAKLAAREA
jgi:hypothetical protein